MADIFLSYAREDGDTAASLVAMLGDCGWSVFWDHHIPTGKSFDRVIEEQLDAATCVIVMWSCHAVASDWVRAEAREGARREVLRPVQIDEVTLPLEFRHLQTINLAGWRRGTPHAECDRLLADLKASIGRGSLPGPVPPELPFYRRRPIQALMAGAAVALALVAWSFGGRTPDTVSATRVERPLAAPAQDPEKTNVVEIKKPVSPAGGPEKTFPVKKQPAPPDVEKQPTPPPAPTPTPSPAAVANEASLKEAVRAYEQAVSSGSRDAVRAVFPSVTERQLRDVESLRDNFGRDRYRMNIIILKSQIDGLRAVVRCRVFHSGVDDSGKPYQDESQETLTFEWNGTSWVRVR